MHWPLAARKKKLLLLHLLLLPLLLLLLLLLLKPLLLLLLLPPLTLLLPLVLLLAPLPVLQRALLPVLLPVLLLVRLLLPHLLHRSNPARLEIKPAFGPVFFSSSNLEIPEPGGTPCRAGTVVRTASSADFQPAKSFFLTGDHHFGSRIGERAGQRLPRQFRRIVLLAEVRAHDARQP